MPISHVVNRRVFLKQTGAAALLAGLILYKPCIAKTLVEADGVDGTVFSTTQKSLLSAVQMHLFPADGDGPSAIDINALGYLEWALTDVKNIEDGDPAYIIKGIVWLEKLAIDTMKQGFMTLSTKQQHTVIESFSQSERGDNWLSLLVYYLLEALLLDPVYGGNTNMLGWKWIEHQAGFPRPSKTKNYHHYLR